MPSSIAVAPWIGNSHPSRVRIGGDVFEWGPRDVFVVPSWQARSLEADEESVLFCYSDRPVQEVLGLLREESGEGV